MNLTRSTSNGSSGSPQAQSYLPRSHTKDATEASRRGSSAPATASHILSPADSFAGPAGFCVPAVGLRRHVSVDWIA